MNAKTLSYLPAVTALLALAALPFSFALGSSVIAVGGLFTIMAHDYAPARRALAMHSQPKVARLPLAA